MRTVAARYETRMRWNHAGSRIWSDVIAREPLISAEGFPAAQAIHAQPHLVEPGRLAGGDGLPHPLREAAEPPGSASGDARHRSPGTAGCRTVRPAPARRGRRDLTSYKEP